MGKEILYYGIGMTLGFLLYEIATMSFENFGLGWKETSMVIYFNWATLGFVYWRLSKYYKTKDKERR